MTSSFPRTVRMPRAARFLTVGVAAAVLLGTALAQSPLAAHAADPILNTASGVEILDIDGGTLQAQTPLSQWSSGPDASGHSDGTGSKFKLNTTVTTDITTTAGVGGSTASIGSGEFTLRDRPPVTFTGLRSVCAPDGTSTVAVDSLAVDGTDLTAQANSTAATPAGFTYNLPDSIYGPTRIIVGVRTTASNGMVKVTGLRVEAESGASEIWRVRLAEVTCASYPVETPTPTPAPTPDPVAVTPLVTGVTVTAQDGTVLIDGEPRITEAGTTATAETVTATDFPASASDVTVTSSENGAARASIGQFTQVPDTSSIGEYLWSALRVYGLHLDVAADGSSAVSFDNSGSAVFVNGVWINTATDLYTGVDASGTERVRVYFNERVLNADGSTTITALRYEDLTGINPDVSLGQVRVVPATAPEEPTEPEVPVEPELPVLPQWYAYGVVATGPSPVSATPLAHGVPDAATAGEDNPGVASSTAASNPSSTVPNNTGDASDGATGQISATGITVSAASTAASADATSVSLYPNTRAAVSLANLRVAVDENGTTVTTDGGTVAGTTVPAGEIAPNTVFALDGTSVRVVLNEQITVDGDLTVLGLHLSDVSGLASDVRVAGVTTVAPAVVDPTEPGTDPTEPGVDPADPADPNGPSDPADPTDPADPADPSEPADPADSTEPTVPGTTPGAPGAGVSPGALSPDGSSPAGTSGTRNTASAAPSSDALANTGTNALAAGMLALLLVGAGAATVLVRRRASARR